MRPGQQNKRGRGRGNNNNGGGSSNGGGGNNNFQRKGGNPLSRTYDSSGPDVKIRGTAQHIAEKYSNLARDAQSSGDRVIAENYLQHAEHYYRIIAAAQAQMQDRFQSQDRADYQDRDGNSIDQDDMDGGDGDDLGYAPQPVFEEQQPQPQPQRREQPPQGQDQQPRENRRDREPRRDRRPDRPERAERPVEPKAEQKPEPKVEQKIVAAPQVTEAAEISAPVVDGSGPQPVIDGTPAEVAVEEAAQAEAAPRRRRAAATRPRRQPRKTAEGAEGDDAAPALVTEEAGE
ncbi:DUF4167 domain-containing protein [Aliirhizobium smilacinae]|uniref:DUF4167 domain-containing protein n=1 Tax=Aliirhizobium smilacinae TaxID=1395944 RepID=A0A5C4X8B6_9HYPH|nr:DUF4167 domain-containing protein [Rhizobium smilacinae]TNM59666.1 DUF4167 domain-containing protein [Rhizobium smilacinae]